MNSIRSVVRVRARTFATWRELSPESKANLFKWTIGLTGSLVGFGYLVYREERKAKEAEANATFARERAAMAYRMAALAEAKAEEVRNHHTNSNGNQTRNSETLAKIAEKYSESGRK